MKSAEPTLFSTVGALMGSWSPDGTGTSDRRCGSSSAMAAVAILFCDVKRKPWPVPQGGDNDRGVVVSA